MVQLLAHSSMGAGLGISRTHLKCHVPHVPPSQYQRPHPASLWAPGSLAQCEEQCGVISGLPDDGHPNLSGAAGQVPTIIYSPYRVCAFPTFLGLLPGLGVCSCLECPSFALLRQDTAGFPNLAQYGPLEPAHTFSPSSHSGGFRVP